jgi:phospholipid/cholesterol/gamma-HCH transport system substrate-binding protein
MEPKVSYVVVGAFVAVFGAMLIVIVLWLVRGGPQKTYRSYYAYFGESVSGLTENSVVRYKGINVGRVRNMRLDPENPERVRLVLDIAEGTPIKEDTIASLAPRALRDSLSSSSEVEPATHRRLRLHPASPIR